MDEEPTPILEISEETNKASEDKDKTDTEDNIPISSLCIIDKSTKEEDEPEDKSCETQAKEILDTVPCEDNINISNTSKESVENIESIQKFIENQDKEIAEAEQNNKKDDTIKSLKEEMEDKDVIPEVVTVKETVQKGKDDDKTLPTIKTENESEKKEKCVKISKEEKEIKEKLLNESLAVASSMMDMILSEPEVKKETTDDKEKQPDEKGPDNNMALSVGSKVEAKDYEEDWYPAEIVEVDYEEMEVLVHYENVSKKHDEWISVSSPRLRPIGAASPSIMSMPDNEAVPSTSKSEIEDTSASETPKIKNEREKTPVENKTKADDKPKLSFVVGERCLARWRDNRRFIATVQSDLGNGNYDVIFDDGIKWTCNTSRLSKMRKELQETLSVDTASTLQGVSTPSPLPSGGPTSSPLSQSTPLYPPAYHTHLFDPTRDYLGSKSERREKKRKLNIKEIFNIGQKKFKKDVSPKEKVPKAKTTKRVVEKKLRNVKGKAPVKTLPDAVASIIGTIKEEPTEEGNKSSVYNNESVNMDNTDPVDNANEVSNASTVTDDDVDPVVKEEVVLERFEEHDVDEAVIDKMKKVINKLEDGLNEVTAEPVAEVKEELSDDTAEVVEEEEAEAVVNEDSAEEVVKDDSIEDLVKDESIEEVNIDIAHSESEPVEIIVVDPTNAPIKERHTLKLKSKVKKSKKLRLLQEKNVKKQVERVKSQLVAMKRQMDEMRRQMMEKTEALARQGQPGQLQPGDGGLLPGEWCCRWLNGQPVGELVEADGEVKVDANGNPSLPRRVIRVEDKRLPPGWTKVMVRRSIGNSAGKWDVVLLNSDQKRFHSKLDMRNYMEQNPHLNLGPYKQALLDFGVHVKLARRLGWYRTDPSIPDLEPRVILSPIKTPKLPEARVKVKKNLSLKKKARRPHQLYTGSSSSKVEVLPEPLEPLEEGYVYVGSLKVQIIENLLRCPAEGCLKNFRNHLLLKMHIKHYHRELRKMLGSTPKVLELAAARTKPNKGPTKVREGPKKPKIPKAPKREEPKPETTVLETSVTPQDATSKLPETEKIPRSLDGPKLRQALVKPKRPKVLLPVRRPDVDEQPLPDAFEDIEPTSSIIDEPILEPLDFETAISTHTVTKPLEKIKTIKKKTFATISKKVVSEDDEWYGMNSDVETMSSFPRSVSPDSKCEPPVASSEIDEQKPLDNYVYTETGERIKIVHMRREEIINCHCGFREEDGLMVQCELCLCWQHALCHNIHKEADVPEKYTCSICLNPRRGRRSQRFLHDQDRLYEGLLPGARASEALRRAHELAGNLLRIKDSLHALRVKYHVATKKNHPKLYLWAKDWEIPEISLIQEKLNSDYSDLNIIINNIGKENMPLKEIDLSTDEQDGDRQSHLSHSLLSGILSSPGGASLDLPICTSELERLAKSVQEQEPEVLAPQPEAAIENGACRERLLKHIQRCHTLIDCRLDSIEAQVAELESQDPSFEDDETADYFPRTKQTIQMLLKDLDTMEELGIIT